NIRISSVLKYVAIYVALSLPLATAVHGQTNLTGVWSGDDGGLYYVRQAGATFWWAGLSTESPLGANDFHLGVDYANVYRGTISGDRITGHWADVPRGQNLNDGDLTLQIVTVGVDGAPGGIILKKLSESGGFGPSMWQRADPAGSSCDVACRFRSTV